MPTEITTYCNCMEQVKQRIGIVKAVLAGLVTTGHEFSNVELIFVQFRKVLELVAFASLSANKAKYSAAYESFARHWNAERMLRDLEKINEDFYPKPVDGISQSELENRLAATHGPQQAKHATESAAAGAQKVGADQHFFDHVRDGFMTKEEFVALYDKCGKILHARNPFSTEDPVIQIGYGVEQWVARIQRLLASHMVRLVDSDTHWYVCIPVEGKVHAYVLSSGTAASSL